MNQKSLEQRIAELEDREAIREVLATYIHGLDKHDEDQYMSIWDGNAELHINEQYGGPVYGAQNIREQINSIWGMLPQTHHVGGNAVISIDGTTAKSLSDVTAVAYTPDGTPILSYATYKDQLRKAGGKWSITRRDTIISYSAPVVEVYKLVSK